MPTDPPPRKLNLKPFDDARFERALARAKENAANGKAQPQPIERFAIRSAGQVIFVNVANIDWIEAADYYAALHVGDKTLLWRCSLSDLEQDLASTTLCRIHRSTIVNLERVRGLKLNKDGDYTLQLCDGVELGLSRRHRKEVRNRLGIGGSD